VTRSAFLIELARGADALAIAELSRDSIEHGLGWRWTRDRVMSCIRDQSTNVIVARRTPSAAGNVIGFGIMRYQQRSDDETAHLLLFAVAPAHRREGIGSALLAWLETTALTAGTGVICLEARLANGEARAFYRHHGYCERAQVRAMYRGVEDGIRIAKDLWVNASAASRTSS
jgi:ribosomal-protein-alanine N-acetyltransferase